MHVDITWVRAARSFIVASLLPVLEEIAAFTNVLQALNALFFVIFFLLSAWHVGGACIGMQPSKCMVLRAEPHAARQIHT